MTDRAMAIAVLCSHLCTGNGIIPLEPREYSDFAALLDRKGLAPEALLAFGKEDFIQQLELDENQTERFLRLIDRSGVGYIGHVEDLIHRNAHDRRGDQRNALKLPVLGIARDIAVELRGVLGNAAADAADVLLVFAAGLFLIEVFLLGQRREMLR